MSTDYRLDKPKSKKITLADIDEKYLPEWFVEMRKDKQLIIHDNVAAQAIEAALNMKRLEQERKLEAKRDEEQRRIMAQREKQETERREQERARKAEYLKHLPEKQVEMIFSGKRDKSGCCDTTKYAEFYGHSTLCKNTAGEDLEPGLRLLQQEYSNGRLIIRLVGELAYNRLVEFAKDDETWPDLMNRLLDVAVATVKTKRTDCFQYLFGV
jgi:hypothetical protein